MPSAAQVEVKAAPVPGVCELVSAVGSSRVVPARDVMVVVAHPDDETLGCGGQLAHWRHPTVVVVTDGAPRREGDARAQGFRDAAAYAEARHRELLAALEIAGVAADGVICLGVADQRAAFHLTRLTYRLAELFAAKGTRLVFTHAYEGGHPDHDAVTFAVHCAAGLSRQQPPPLVVEMPLYHARGTGMAVQAFLPGAKRLSIVRWLTDAERAIKRRMVAAHRTQKATLASFAIDAERFGIAPAHDFGELPNDGALLYERHDWGIDGAQWRALARDALAALRSRGLPC
jgi:LmbE family N-acetylglucosaminyl deacetylase